MQQQQSQPQRRPPNDQDACPLNPAIVMLDRLLQQEQQQQQKGEEYFGSATFTDLMERLLRLPQQDTVTGASSQPPPLQFWTHYLPQLLQHATHNTALSDARASELKDAGNKLYNQFLQIQQQQNQSPNTSPSSSLSPEQHQRLERCVQCYTQAAALAATPACLATILNNRSAAYYSGGRLADSAADAHYCVCLDPTYHKALRRRGTALTLLFPSSASAAALDNSAGAASAVASVTSHMKTAWAQALGDADSNAADRIVAATTTTTSTTETAATSTSAAAAHGSGVPSSSCSSSPDQLLPLLSLRDRHRLIEALLGLDEGGSDGDVASAHTTTTAAVAGGNMDARFTSVLEHLTQKHTQTSTGTGVVEKGTFNVKGNVFSEPPAVLHIKNADLTVGRDGKMGRFLAARRKISIPTMSTTTTPAPPNKCAANPPTTTNTLLVETPFASAPRVEAVLQNCAFSHRSVPSGRLYPESLLHFLIRLEETEDDSDRLLSRRAGVVIGGGNTTTGWIPRRARGLFCSPVAAADYWRLYGRRENQNVFYLVCPTDTLLALRTHFALHPEQDPTLMTIPGANKTAADSSKQALLQLLKDTYKAAAVCCNPEEGDADDNEEHTRTTKTTTTSIRTNNNNDNKKKIRIDDLSSGGGGSYDGNKFGRKHMETLCCFSKEMFPSSNVADLVGGFETALSLLAVFAGVFAPPPSSSAAAASLTAVTATAPVSSSSAAENHVHGASCDHDHQHSASVSSSAPSLPTHIADLFAKVLLKQQQEAQRVEELTSTEEEGSVVSATGNELEFTESTKRLAAKRQHIEAQFESLRKIHRQILANAVNITQQKAIIGGGGGAAGGNTAAPTASSASSSRTMFDHHVKVTVSVAKALYGIASLLNHSCDPNCLVAFGSSGSGSGSGSGGPGATSGQLRLHLLRPVMEGEPLTIAYSSNNFYHAVSQQQPQPSQSSQQQSPASNNSHSVINRFVSHSTRGRIRALRSLYGFACTCKSCSTEVDEPVKKEDEEHYKKASDYFQKGRRLMREGQFAESVTVLYQSYEIVMRYICPPPKAPLWMVPKTHDALAQSFLLHGDRARCIEHLKAALSLTLQLYDPNAVKIVGMLKEEDKKKKTTNTMTASTTVTTTVYDENMSKNTRYYEMPNVPTATVNTATMSADFLTHPMIDVGANTALQADFERLASICFAAAAANAAQQQQQKDSTATSTSRTDDSASEFEEEGRVLMARAQQLFELFYA